MKLKTAIIATIFLQVGTAFAAAPNLVGTWEAVSGYWASTGTDSKPAPAELAQKPVQKKLVIQAQQGNAFNGASIRYTGESRLLAGVIAADGKSLLFSTDYGISSGSLSKDNSQINFCGTTIELNRNMAYCTTFQKVK